MREGEQGLRVDAAIARVQDGLFVDEHLAGETRTRGHQACAGMEPPHSAPDFFEHRGEPIAAADVNQLVAQHCLLYGRWQPEHAARQQHDRRPHAHGGRTSDLV